MSSPFPGMDPYLENPTVWGDFHHDFITSIKGALNATLAPRFYVRVEERVYISEEDDPGRTVIIPDAHIVEARENWGKSWAVDDGGDVAVSEPIICTTLLDPEVREAFLNIYDAEYRDIVTVIEVLSPSNKVRGSRGRESFVHKRREVMNSPANWMELDLLRQGESALPANIVKPRCDYYVHVSRAIDRPKGMIWPILLTQRLPGVEVPLKPGDDDVPLDLQAVFNETYDRSAYQISTDYAAESVPALSPQLAEWSNALLVQKGLRNGAKP